ncbi:MAG: ribonuclease PH [Syntrophomonadaceae bacterium]|nr:ribonuclease PH [Syntrophomonadaceae bacterium]
MIRNDGRLASELRPVSITPNYQEFAEGSVLIEMGRTRVLCAASVEERVPPHVKGTGSGWVTAEYSLLPRSTHQRTVREVSRGKPGGRTHEIQRLIGRSLRSVVDLNALGERTVWVDCDVIQADGGTRTASVTGGFLAMVLALAKIRQQGLIDRIPITDYLAAVSVGMVEGEARLDLSYQEDSRADVDMNVVMTGSGLFVEVQGTAEAKPFSQQELDQFLNLARSGISQLIKRQQEVFQHLLGNAAPWA